MDRRVPLNRAFSLGYDHPKLLPRRRSGVRPVNFRAGGLTFLQTWGQASTFLNYPSIPGDTDCVTESLRILLCTGEFPPSPSTGGIGTGTRSAAAALAVHHDVHVLHCEAGLEPHDVTDPHGFTVHRRPIGRVSNRLFGRFGASQAWAFRRHADRLGRFDVVEAPDWEAAIAGFVIRRRQPVVANLFTPTEVIRSHGGTGGGWLRARLERWACQRADAVASSGPTLSADLAARGWFSDATDMPVRPLCLDPESSMYAASPVSGDPYVLGIGRLEARKGFGLLIRAVAQLSDRPEVVVVGRDVIDADGSRGSETLTNLANELGVRLRLEAPVRQPELEPLIEQAWVVAVPSTFESFSMAALEAAARARAVVGTDRIGFVALAADGEGVFCTAHTPEAFSQAIGPLLADRSAATAAGLAAQRMVRRDFGPATYAANRNELYDLLLERV
ncbi:MAG: glycogen(starch) synthase [Myxococcota bacterium]